MTSAKNGESYRFDSVFDSSSDNGVVYAHTARRIVEGAIKGFDGTIAGRYEVGSLLCYGETGSGKSYTLYGTEKDLGLVQRLISDLFCELARKSARSPSKQRFTLALSFLEIYQEKANDLIMPSRRDLQLVESSADETRVRGLTEYTCETAEDALAMLRLGRKGAGNVNAHTMLANRDVILVVE